MKNLKYLMSVVIVLLVITACGSGTTEQEVEPMPAFTETIAPTEKEVPPTSTPLPDISNVKITLDDLPDDYFQVTMEDMDMTYEDLLGMLFFDTTNENIINPGFYIKIFDTVEDSDIVMSFVVYPLSSEEKEMAKSRLDMINATGSIEDFMGPEFTYIPEADDAWGEDSSGFGNYEAMDDGMYIAMDMVYILRENLVCVVISTSMRANEISEPNLDIGTIATTFDTHAIEFFGH